MPRRVRLPWRALLGLLCAAAATAVAAEEAGGTCFAANGLCGPSTGAASGAAYYWPMQKGSVGRTGYFDYEVPKLRRGWKPRWSWFDPFDDVVRATPLIDEQKNIYLTTIAGRIYKFNAMGVIVWEKKIDSAVPTAGSLYNGSLFIGTRYGELLSLDMETGQYRWRKSISQVGLTGSDTSTIFALNGMIVAAAHTTSESHEGNSDVVGVSSKDGRVVWRFQPNMTTRNLQVCSPGDDTIIFQDQAADLYRLGLANGSLIWKTGTHMMSGLTQGAAVCHGDKVYSVINEGHFTSELVGAYMEVYAVDTGRWIWQVRLPYAANQAVAIGPNPANSSGLMVVVGVGASPRMPPIFTATSELGVWMGLLVHQVDLNFPWVFGERKRALLAYDAELGRRLWHFELEPYAHAAAAGESQRVRQRHADVMSGANADNDFMCLPAACSSPVIGPDGTIYVGWQDGRIYAIKDQNHDNKIDPDTEVRWHELGDAMSGSLALAPGMLVAAPCGGGLHVFTS